jgi:chromosomal replication initiator protein
MNHYVFPGLSGPHKYLGLINALTGYVAQSHGVSVDDIKSKSRKSEVKESRFICMYMLRTFTDMTLEDIGLQYKRDHATVLYAVGDIQYQIDNGLGMRVGSSHRYVNNYIKELERKFITSKYLIT